MEASPGPSGEAVENFSAYWPGDPGLMTVSPPPLTNIRTTSALTRANSISRKHDILMDPLSGGFDGVGELSAIATLRR